METFFSFLKGIALREISSWFWLVFGLGLLVMGLMLSDLWTSVVDKFWRKVTRKKKPTSQED